jgi:hypothetical protein
MLKDEPTEPIIERGSSITLPGAARAAQVIQAQADMQETMTTLADQLLVLFDEIPTAGLIRQNRRPMHQYVQTYFRMADGVWEALATDKLDELTSNPGYTIIADALEQKLLSIHDDCQQADQHPQARGSRLWRRRVRLYSRSLLEWKRCLDTGVTGKLPDPTACGRTLYRAHSRIGLAGINGFDYLLITGLPLLGMLTSLLLAVLFGVMNVLMPVGLPRSLVPTILAGLSTIFILWFSAGGSSTLPLIAGYTLTQRQSMLFTRTLRASVNAKTSLGLRRIVLRVLLTTFGLLLAAALAAVLVITGLVAAVFFTEPHTGSQDIGSYLANIAQANLGQNFQIDPMFTTLLFPIIGLLLTALFFLPFTLSVQASLVRALLGHPTRSPETRRSALQPALEVLSFHITTLLFIVILANSIANLGADTLLPAGWPLVSARLLVYIAALLVPYLLLVYVPFREGITRWQNAMLHELALRRNEIAQRLSRVQPQSNEQADLRTIQEYLTWQYYRTQETEVKETSSAPFSFERSTLVVILAILGAIALEQINQLLHTLV